jgi:hypothetical protein
MKTFLKIWMILIVPACAGVTIHVEKLGPYLAMVSFSALATAGAFLCWRSSSIKTAAQARYWLYFYTTATVFGSVFWFFAYILLIMAFEAPSSSMATAEKLAILLTIFCSLFFPIVGGTIAEKTMARPPK